MCGLAGIFHPDARAGIDAAMLRRMTTSLAHRGPDGDGFCTEPGIGHLPHRPAVIDPAAIDPAGTPDGGFVVERFVAATGGTGAARP